MRRAALLAVVGIVVLFYSSPAPAQSTSAAQSNSSSSLGTAAAPGTTIKVNTDADESNTDGDCSLREAIKAANTNKAVDGCAAGSSRKQDAIRFALGTQATITLLGSSLPTITDPSGLSIDGQKAKITVSGNDKVRVFGVRPGGKLALLHLTVANGQGVGNGDRSYGGGIRNDGGTLKVSNSTFSGNRSAIAGGGISNFRGSTKVMNSTFSGNRASFSGGGIINTWGTLKVSNSTFSGNSANDRGGGIYIDGGTATVSNSTFFGNHAEGSNSSFSGGGGIANLFDSTLKVSNSTFSKNAAAKDGAKFGGGIHNAFGSTATVANSTFSDNHAFSGGGIDNVQSTLTLTNSTFSKNNANMAGGIRNDRGRVTLKNTIVANSTKGKNCSGKISDGGYNIEDGTSRSFSAAKNSLPSTNPKLASSLANNGGPTKTIKLLEGSPAINAIPQGTNGCGTKFTTDQRGVKRPQGKGCEIGAFEKRQ